MRNRLIIIAIAAIFTLFIFSKCSQKETRPINSALDQKSYLIIDAFFKDASTGDTSAIIKLLKQNENIDLTDSLTKDLQSKFNFINQNSGAFVSDKLLRKKILNDDVGVYCYLVKYDKKFYRFTFVFYNNNRDVKIFRFSFDETVDIELEESIKLYAN